MKKQTFLQRFGGYVIDAIFCLGSIAATVDYFIRGENHTAAFGLVALYAFVVIQRIRSLRKSCLDKIAELENQIPKASPVNHEPHY